jgi:hypothetical protein
MDIRTISVPLTCEAAAYADGDLIGGKITIPFAVLHPGAGGIIRRVVLACKSSQTTALDIVFFNGDPSSTTFTENGAIAIATADVAKIVGGFNVAATTGWIDVGTPSFAQSPANGIAFPFYIPNGTSLYAAIISRGAPTFAATTDLTLNLGIES